MADRDQLIQSLARNLRRWRGERGFTLDALAARAGVSRGMIIRIEQARTNPSVGTAAKLADALGVGIAALLEPEPDPEVRLVPPGQAARSWSTPAGSHKDLLVGTERRGSVQLWSWLLMPGDHSPSDPHPVGAVELLHVRCGTLTLVVDGVVRSVPAGTSAAFASDVPHDHRNDGTEPVRLTTAVSIPPPR